MEDPIYGIDWGKSDSHTVIAIYGMRSGKTILLKWWSLVYSPDMLSKALIRRLAAEAILTISLNN
jgi:hypothetical protein